MKVNSGNYLFVVVTLLLLSCSKDKTEKLVYRDLSFDPLSVTDKLPAGLKESDDPYARLVYDDITAMTDWGEFGNQLRLPGDVVKMNAGVNSEKYKWTLNAGTALLLIDLTFSRDGDYYQWQENVRYGIGTTNEYLTARENKSGNAGTLDYNVQWFCGLDSLITPCDPNYRHYEWTIHTDQKLEYSSEMDMQAGDNAVTAETRLTLNADGSGTLNAFNGSVLYYEAVWDAQGSGSYTQHNGNAGTTHNWTVD